jgi:cysteine desulfuration protein SufE
MRIVEAENEIVEEFELIGDDWEGKYEHLIDLGNDLPLIDKQYKTDDRLIKGCQSRVWLHSELQDQKVVFTADSDAIITKGIVAILIRVFSGQTPEEIMQADLKFDQIREDRLMQKELEKEKRLQELQAKIKVEAEAEKIARQQTLEIANLKQKQQTEIIDQNSQTIDKNSNIIYKNNNKIEQKTQIDQNRVKWIKT